MTLTIRQFLEAYDRGEFAEPDRETQIKAGWYDWFCKDETLHKRTHKLVKCLKSILPSAKIDIDKTYVWFNNCPMVGSLYDDFRIADLESGDTLYTIIPASGFKKCKGRASVYDVKKAWGLATPADNPIDRKWSDYDGEGQTWGDVVNFFKDIDKPEIE